MIVYKFENRNDLNIINDYNDFFSTKEDCRLIYDNKSTSSDKKFLFWLGNTSSVRRVDVFKKPNSSPPLYLSKYYNSCLIGNSLLINSKSFVAKDCIINNRFFNERSIKIKNKGEIFLKDNAVKCSSKYEVVLALTSSGLQKAYTHWFTEILPKAIPFSKLKERHENLKVVVEDVIPNYQIEMLNLIGINNDDIIKKTIDQEVSADVIYLLSPPGLVYLHDSVFELYEYMSSKLDISKVRKRYKSIGSKIFLSRRELANRRTLLNIFALQNISLSFGFEVVVPEEMNIHEKIFVFSQATHVIGEAGGGLTNIVFSGKGTRVISLSSDAFPSPIFSNIAVSKNINLGYIFGSSIQYGFNKHNNNSHFVIDESIFLEGLKIILECQK